MAVAGAKSGIGHVSGLLLEHVLHVPLPMQAVWQPKIHGCVEGVWPAHWQFALAMSIGVVHVGHSLFHPHRVTYSYYPRFVKPPTVHIEYTAHA